MVLCLHKLLGGVDQTSDSQERSPVDSPGAPGYLVMTHRTLQRCPEEGVSNENKTTRINSSLS